MCHNPIRNTRLLPNFTYIHNRNLTKKKNQPKLIHTLIVAPIVHMRHLTPHTRYTIYDTFSHTHATPHTYPHSIKLTTLFLPLFFRCYYVNENIFHPPLTIHKPIEYTHTHKMHIINFKIRNSYNATNALKKKRKKKKNHHNKSPSARITLFR